MGWALHWRGAVLREGDVIGAHAAIVSGIAGNDGFVNLDPRSGVLRLMAWLTVVEVVASGGSLEQARDVVGRAPLSEILAAFDPDDDEPPASASVVAHTPPNAPAGTAAAEVPLPPPDGSTEPFRFKPSVVT